MPQFDVGTYSSQIFWLIVCLVALYIFVRRVTIPNMKEILETRWLSIEGNREKARVLTEQAEELQQEFENQLTQAREHSHEMITSAIRNVSLLSSKRKRDTSEMLLARVQSAEARINRQKVQWLGDLRETTEDITTTLVQRLTRQKPSLAQVKRSLERNFKYQGSE